MMPNTIVTICLFARAPNLGQVKSRLAAGSNPQLALHAHIELVQRVVGQIQRFKQTLTGRSTAGCQVQLWLAGSPGDARASALVDQWQRQLGASLHPQQGANLGVRMQHAVAANVAEAFPTLVVGADCPGITAEYLATACEMLKRGTTVVLGPAEDGGYGLIGLARSVPGVFQDIDWGTSRVLRQTQAQCVAAGVRSAQLPTIWDVDDIRDWQRYCQEYSVPS